MSVTITLELHARPEATEELIQLFRDTLPDTRGWDGCQDVIMHRDQDNPSHLLVIEHWDSRKHYEAYFAWRQETGDFEKAKDMVTQPPSLQFFDRLEDV